LRLEAALGPPGGGYRTLDAELLSPCAVSSALTPRGRKSIVITAVALIVAAGEGAAIVHYLHKPAVMASAPVPVFVPAPQPSQHVRLDVERHGQSLRLRWDGNAAAVGDATHAILHIGDGIHQSQLDLDSTLLHSGLLSYWPETRNVDFRLELFTPSQIINESIRAVNGTPTEPVADAVATQPRRHAPSEGQAERSEEADQTHPSPFASPKTLRPACAVAKAAPKNTAVPEITAKEEPPTPAPPPLRPTEVRELVVPLPPPAPEPEATEVTEPAQGSRWGRIAGKIPLLRRLVKHPQSAPDPTP